MRNLAARCALVALPLVASCGGGDTPKPLTPDPNAVAVEPPPAAPIATARPSAVPAPRNALEKLTQLGIRSGADIAVVIDGDKLRGSLANDLLAPIARISREIFDAVCGMSPLEDVVRGAGSFFGKPERVYVAFETKHPAKDWVRCAARLMKATPVEEGREVPSADDATWFEVRDIRIEARDEHTFVVSPAGEGALAPNLDSKFAGLTLQGDRILEAQGDLPVSSRETVRNIRFDISGDPGALSAHVVLDLPDGKGAEFTEKMNEARASFGSKGAKGTVPPIAWLFQKLRYTVSGDHVEGSIAVDKTDVGSILNIMSLFLGGGAREYSSQSKAAEARSTLRQLGRMAVMRTELEAIDPKNPAKSTRLVNCPPSTPLTPAKVPRGVTYQSTAADWSKPGWKALRFVMTEPQRYAYGITTAPDGKSCTFYALGDLNGDGKTSRFELKARVRPQPGSSGQPELWVAPSVLETQPFE